MTDPTLAEAEKWARDAIDRAVPHHLVTLLAEYERRGAELERLRARVADLVQRDEANLIVISRAANSRAELERRVRDLEATQAVERDAARVLAEDWGLARADGGTGALSAMRHSFPGLIRRLDKHAAAHGTEVSS